MHKNTFGGQTRWGSLSAPPVPLAANVAASRTGGGQGEGNSSRHIVFPTGFNHKSHPGKE